jgi:ABC-type Fe3+ transport system permease subunit
MSALVSVLLVTTIASSFGESYALVTGRRYARGTRQRYAWRSVYITLAWIVIFQCFGLALLDVVGDSLVFGGVWAAIGVIRYAELRFNRDSDDDDWWKGRGRKIWAGAKRRLAALLPTPASRPVTA